MRTFRNNHKRGRFRSNDRNYKRNGETSKFSSDYSSNSNFQRNSPSRNNHNAPKLIEKYNDLAREALSNGDKILSENYFQHADHFTRILAEKENLKLSKEKDNKNAIEVVSDNTKLASDETENQEKQILKT
jgi:hypothetical protein